MANRAESFMQYHDSPWHDPCPACSAHWITHPDKSWGITHTDNCLYMAWLDAMDGKDKASDD